jgi:hypothetical protein
MPSRLWQGNALQDFLRIRSRKRRCSRSGWLTTLGRMTLHDELLARATQSLAACGVQAPTGDGWTSRTPIDGSNLVAGIGHDAEAITRAALVEAGLGVSPVTDLMLRLRHSTFDVIRLEQSIERHVVAVVRTTSQQRPTVLALLSILHTLAAADPGPEL